MDEGQVARVSAALGQSAESIQNINSKVDIVDEHWQGMQTFNSGIASKVDDTLESFQRLDKAINARVGKALTTVEAATGELTRVMEDMVNALERFDMRREMNQLPKAVIPLMIPLVILMIELAVANAYLGILLTRLPDVGEKYSSYLLGNAAVVLLGLSLSLLWLGVYRCILSCRTRRATQVARLRAEARFASEANRYSGEEELIPEEDEEVDKGRRAVKASLMLATTAQLELEISRRRTSCDEYSMQQHNITVLRQFSRESEHSHGATGGPRQRRRLSLEGGSLGSSPEVPAAQASPRSPTSQASRERTGVKVFWQTPLQAHAVWGAKKTLSREIVLPGEG